MLDSRWHVLPVGAAGELHVGGAGVGRGYQHDAARTAEAFVPDPFSVEPGSRMYKTGDLARFLPDGNVEFLGRLDHQVKVRGFRIELGEIEAALRQHPSVREAVVEARAYDGALDKRLVAYVVVDSPAPAAELRGFLKGRLPDYMLPSAFVALERLPLTPNGKVDRKRLPEPDEAARVAEAEFFEPSTPTEQALEKIWAEVLGREHVSVHSNFFELGGHSLLATQVCSRVQRAFGARVPVRMLFESPTVEEFARVVSDVVLAEVEGMSEDEAEGLNAEGRDRPAHT
jgi:acyl carrier protein